MEYKKITFLYFAILIFLVSLGSTRAQEITDFPYFCDLNVSYYPGFDGQAYEEFHKSRNKVRGKTMIFHGDHPSHGPFEQLGVKLIADVCYKNENTGQVYVEDPEDLWIKNSGITVEKHEYSLTDFILIFLDGIVEKRNF